MRSTETTVLDNLFSFVYSLQWMDGWMGYEEDGNPAGTHPSLLLFFSLLFLFPFFLLHFPSFFFATQLTYSYSPVNRPSYPFLTHPLDKRTKTLKHPG